MGAQTAGSKSNSKRARQLHREGLSTPEILKQMAEEGYKTRTGQPLKEHNLTYALLNSGVRRRSTAAKKSHHTPTHAHKLATRPPILAAIISILSVKSLSAEDRIAMALIMAEARQ